MRERETHTHRERETEREREKEKERDEERRLISIKNTFNTYFERYLKRNIFYNKYLINNVGMFLSIIDLKKNIILQ